jgi:hypothetical protein
VKAGGSEVIDVRILHTNLHTDVGHFIYTAKLTDLSPVEEENLFCAEIQISEHETLSINFLVTTRDLSGGGGGGNSRAAVCCMTTQ